MSKKIQLVLSEEASNIVEALLKEASLGFELGRITYTDVINELILCSKPDVKQLQMKHTSVRKSLLMLSNQKGIDFDTVIKTLSELRARTSKRQGRVVLEQEAQS